MNWITDDKGNRASVEYWGDEKSAKKSLTTLDGCRYCDNCSNCSNCSDCSRCSDCSDCSDCSGCSGCSRCSNCSDCSDCSGMAPAKVEQPAIPVIENIHQKIYAAASQPNALDMNGFHSCETTHCRAGWAVHLAGKAGYDLERRTSPVFAAMQIYEASGYLISPCRFFESNEKAMEDMRKLAEATHQPSP